VYISHKPFFKDVKIITKDKGEIIVFSWPSERRPTSFNDFLWFAKIYFMYKPEIIIGHFVGSNIAIIVSKFLSFGRVKSYVYYHTLRNQILMDSKNSFIKNEYLFLRKKLFYEIFCDNIICPSELAKKDLVENYHSKRGIVVLNPMVDRFKIKKNKTPVKIVISYLGRLENSKGVLDLLEGFMIYKKQNLNSKIILNIAGTGSQQEQIKEQLKENNSIFYLGGLSYDRIDDYLNCSHYTIIPSKFDAFNVVGLESMMNHTPLLISNVVGLSFYLQEGKECYKFNSTIDEIVELFGRVEMSSRNYNQMSINARNTFLERFSMENYCRIISKIIL
jgi:glycosyltransferase involved in cell wall biosynthesis